MNLELNDIQAQLQNSLSRLLTREYSFEARNRHVQGPRGHSAAVWAQLAELGVLGAAIGEPWGGFGGDAVDQMLIAQALGEVLATEPYQSTVVMAAGAIDVMGTPAQKEKWLPRIVQGEVQLGWAHQEQSGGMVTSARLAHGTWRLSGRKTLVLDAPNCVQWIVSAKDERGALALFLVDAGSANACMDTCRLIDGSLAADLRLESTSAERIDGLAPEAVPAALDRLLNIGITGACAEMVGAMEAASKLTFEYLKTRHQFGRAIGTNQALQHRAVDMLVALEQSRSLVMSIALALVGRNEFALGEGQFHAAKVLVGRNARRVTQEAIQMHGGIGMTEECAVGHYLRRVLVLDQLHGDTQQHLGVLEGR